MDIGFTTAAYVVAAVLFILSLGGLSGHELSLIHISEPTRRRGSRMPSSA